MDILQRIDNATVGHKGNAALLGLESWRELNGSLKGIERIYEPKIDDRNFVVNIRGRAIFCILDESLCPYSVKTHSVNVGEGVMDWQPINGAPKNETVLLCIGGKVLAGHWKLEWGAWQAEFCHDDYGELPNPTHWMPLPAPPTT